MTTAIKIAVVGGPNSGKSSLIRRFAKDEFLTCPQSSKCRACEQFGDDGLLLFSGTRKNDTNSELPHSLLQFYRKKRRCTCLRQQPVIRTAAYKGLDSKTYLADLLVMDVPALTPFPQDTQQEFDAEGARGITKASAYILLFDVTKTESFGFMCRTRMEIQDFLRNSTAETAAPIGRKGNVDEEPTSATCGSSLKRSLRRNKDPELAVSPPMPSTTSYDAGFRSVDPIIVIVGTKIDLYSSSKMEESVMRGYETALQTIRKSLKHPYIVCSAKQGYRVDEVFSTAVNAVLVARGLRKKPRAKAR